MINERINLSIEDGIASVVLSRPDKMNALDSKMFAALSMTAELIRDDKSVRVVVISGEGKGFCAGLDMENFSSMLDPNASKDQHLGSLAKRTHGIANDVQHAVWVWHELPMPVIAAGMNLPAPFASGGAAWAWCTMMCAYWGYLPASIPPSRQGH